MELVRHGLPAGILGVLLIGSAAAAAPAKTDDEDEARKKPAVQTPEPPKPLKEGENRPLKLQDGLQGTYPGSSVAQIGTPGRTDKLVLFLHGDTSGNKAEETKASRDQLSEQLKKDGEGGAVAYLVNGKGMWDGPGAEGENLVKALKQASAAAGAGEKSEVHVAAHGGGGVPMQALMKELLKDPDAPWAKRVKSFSGLDAALYSSKEQMALVKAVMAVRPDINFSFVQSEDQLRSPLKAGTFAAMGRPIDGYNAGDFYAPVYEAHRQLAKDLGLDLQRKVGKEPVVYNHGQAAFYSAQSDVGARGMLGDVLNRTFQSRKTREAEGIKDQARLAQDKVPGRPTGPLLAGLAGQPGTQSGPAPVTRSSRISAEQALAQNGQYIRTQFPRGFKTSSSEPPAPGNDARDALAPSAKPEARPAADVPLPRARPNFEEQQAQAQKAEAEKKANLELQQEYNQFAARTPGMKRIPEDGVRGTRTDDAVRRMQAKLGVPQSGTMDEATREALKEELKKPVIDRLGPHIKDSNTVASLYYPYRSSKAIEGGKKDRWGNPVYTLEAYLKGRAPYVSVAMDQNLGLGDGTRLRSDKINALVAKYCEKNACVRSGPVDLRVVDSGDAFIGKGYGRMDIATDSFEWEQGSLGSMLNYRSFDISLYHQPK